MAGHYAVSSLFENYGDHTEIYCYGVDRQEYEQEAEGRSRLVIGRAQITSRITREAQVLSFAVLYLGDHNIAGGVRRFQEEALFQELRESISGSFERADTAAVIRSIDEQFRELTFSLRTLFRDEQRRIIDLILQDRQNSVSSSFRGVYENHASLIRFLGSLDLPVPPAFRAATNIALNDQLRKALEQPAIEAESVRSALREAESSHAALNNTALEFIMRKRIEESAHSFAEHPDDPEALKRLNFMLDLSAGLPFSVNLSEVQNVSFKPLTQAVIHPNGNSGNAAWKQDVAAVLEKLQIRNPETPLMRVPTATYRLQLNASFTFADAEKVLDYLVALGISHVYLSPILTSRKGSTHGYDVTDPTQVDPELGGEAGLDHFQKELRARGLGLILDVVPNHMAACSENRWWMDVLEHGPASPYASYFDVTWRRPDGTDGKVMLPFLGETFGEALDGGLLELSFVGSQLSIVYRGQVFPIAPASYADVLGRNPDGLKNLGCGRFE